MISDKEIVSRILKGDMKAFKWVIQNNDRLVAQIIGKLVLDKDDTKDLCQEVFIKVYHYIKTFRFQSKLSTWIGSIAYKEGLNFLKKKKRMIPITADDEYKLVERDDLPDIMLDKKQAAEYIHSQVSTLPEQYRVVLILFHLEELSHEEIMEITGMPEGTVKNYLFRARKLLKEKLLKDTKTKVYES